jgi:hypothetical protein
VTALGEIKNAAIGWLDLLGARPDAASRFNATRRGFITMLGVYFVLVILTRTIQVAAVFGTAPSLADLLVTVAFNALPLLAVFIVIVLTVMVLRPPVGPLALMVPAGYALCLVLAIGLPLSLFAGNSLSAAIQGILGYMLYRLGRDTGKFGIGVSIGFAVLSVLLLVAIPIGLYMLSVPDLPTPD